MHEYISRLEKIFLLSLVQNAKCQHITRPENLEFLGEFDGGAKITRRTEKAKEKNGKDSYRSLQWRKKKKIQIVEDNYEWQTCRYMHACSNENFVVVKTKEKLRVNGLGFFSVNGLG